MNTVKTAKKSAVKPSVETATKEMKSNATVVQAAPETTATVAASGASSSVSAMVLASGPYMLPPSSTPSVPKGFVAQEGVRYSGILPNSAELNVLPDAITELDGFTAYTTTLGTAVPPYASVLALFNAANAWATERQQMNAWEKYVIEQEGIVWKGMRAEMAKLKPAFTLLSTTNPAVAAALPKVLALLGAKTASAKKAVSTKSANKKAIAAGEAPTHGAVGKKRQKAAEKALYASSPTKGTPSASTLAGGANPVSASPPTNTTPPVVASATH